MAESKVSRSEIRKQQADRVFDVLNDAYLKRIDQLELVLGDLLLLDDDNGNVLATVYDASSETLKSAFVLSTTNKNVDHSFKSVRMKFFPTVYFRSYTYNTTITSERNPTIHAIGLTSNRKETRLEFMITPQVTAYTLQDFQNFAYDVTEPYLQIMSGFMLRKQPVETKQEVDKRLRNN